MSYRPAVTLLSWPAPLRGLATVSFSVALLIALATLTAGCAAGSTNPPGTVAATTALKTSGTAPQTAPPRSSATITAFEVASSVDCIALVDVSVTATYATNGARAVAFLVDGLQVAGSPPKSGSFDLPLRCDGSAHTVILSVVDDQGLFAVKSKAILTTMPAPPASSEPAPSN